MSAFDEKYAAHMASVEAALERLLPVPQTEQAVVVEAMRYGVLGAGKRVRAVLTLEFCKACGGSQREALPFACAVELVHAYSLVHDDLPCMDNDELRRGKPSCWKAYGETVALLAGDGLLTKAFETAAASNLPTERVQAALLLLARASGEHGMLGGQVIDLAGEGKPVPEERLLRMYGMKTGALLRASAVLGCIAAGAPEEKMAAADEYAKKIGLAFQIVDDILDVTGAQDVLGKPIGSDVQSQKTTYVTLHGVEAAKEKALELTEQARVLLRHFHWEDEFLYKMTEMLAVREK